jgi:hypothetical protein
VEAQVHEDQLSDVVDDRLGKAKRLEPFDGHPCAHNLVVMEGHPALADLTRGGLADVVKKRGHAHHELRRDAVHHSQGVAQNVFVPVNGVLFHGQSRKLGEDVVGQPGRHHQLQPLGHPLPHEQLRKLVGDAFARDDRQATSHRPDGRVELVGRGEVQGGHEAAGAQHSQGVVGEGLGRIGRGSQNLAAQVLEAAGGVEDLS